MAIAFPGVNGAMQKAQKTVEWSQLFLSRVLALIDADLIYRPYPMGGEPSP